MPITAKTKLQIVLGIVAVLGSFLFGFVPQYRRASELESQLRAETGRVQTLESDAKLARLRDLASALFLETVNQNYGTASGRASDLFNQVRSMVNDPGSSDNRSTLDEILAMRDSVIGSLAKSDPAAQKQVQSILERALRIKGPPQAAG